MQHPLEAFFPACASALFSLLQYSFRFVIVVVVGAASGPFLPPP